MSKPRANGVAAEVARLDRLRKTAGPNDIAQFVAALRGGDLCVAKTALMGLTDRKALAGPLTDLLHDPDPLLRWRAAALAWFFMLKDFSPQLASRLADDPDPMVRTEAAWGLRSAEDDVAAAALVKATRDPDAMVAYYAAWTLRHILKKKFPHLPSLKRARIPDVALPAEPSAPAAGRPASIGDDALALEQFACQTDLPVYRAPLAGSPKRLTAEPSPASLIHIDGYPEDPLRRTDFTVTCTPKALRFHIRCRYERSRELEARHTEHGQPVYADNSVEVFLEPAGRGALTLPSPGGRGVKTPYFQICLNTRNARCEILHRRPRGHTWRPAGGEEKPWQPRNITSSVRVGKGFWQADLAVPFADLGLRAGKINKLWRMNITRNAHLPELNEITSWADMGDYDSHRPECFGWLWVDAGNVVNADAGVFETIPVPLSPGLPGWTVLSGRFDVRDGQVAPVRGGPSASSGPPITGQRAAPSLSRGGGALRWDKPVPFEQFELAGQAQLRHQVRFLFSPDRGNSGLSFLAAYINFLNEINIATLRRWEHWAPPYPGSLGIYKEVYPRLTHSRWYDLAVRVRKDRLQVLLDGAVHVELPNPRPDVRFIGLGFAGGGALRKLRLRRLD